MEPATAYVVKVKAVSGDTSKYADSDWAEITVTTSAVDNPVVTIEFPGTSDRTIEVSITPDDKVVAFYFLLADADVVDAYIQKNGQDAFTQLVRESGQESAEPVNTEYILLSPEITYTLAVAYEDKAGKLYYTEGDVTTDPKSVPTRIESSLFDDLQGNWTGKQKVMTVNESKQQVEVETSFSVTIAQQVEGYDYRKYNQLVATCDGWDDWAYYAPSDLVTQGGWSEKASFIDYGPKILLTIGANDKVTVDGKSADDPIFAYSDYGGVFLFSADLKAGKMDGGSDLNVVISNDKNTLTIESPAELGSTFFPSLLANSGGWGFVTPGLSSIVLTRVATPATASRPVARRAEIKSGFRTETNIDDFRIVK